MFPLVLGPVLFRFDLGHVATNNHYTPARPGNMPAPALPVTRLPTRPLMPTRRKPLPKSFHFARICIPVYLRIFSYFVLAGFSGAPFFAFRRSGKGEKKFPP